MNAALIGFTGFVGSNLLRSASFESLYNSSNISGIAGRKYDLIVCAGVPAVKWLANKDPARDRLNIESLLKPLSQAHAHRFVLVSTIDVYPDPGLSLDEDAEIAPDNPQAYGRHRLEIESRIRQYFDDVLVVRLPALFGPGLKKNVLFDLLNGNQTENIDPNTKFQWYPVKRLWADIKRAEAANLQLVNLFPEPVATRDILMRHFPRVKVANGSESPVIYQLRTKHATAFGGTGTYLTSSAAISDEIDEFIANARHVT